MSHSFFFVSRKLSHTSPANHAAAEAPPSDEQVSPPKSKSKSKLYPGKLYLRVPLTAFGELPAEVAGSGAARVHVATATGSASMLWTLRDGSRDAVWRLFPLVEGAIGQDWLCTNPPPPRIGRVEPNSDGVGQASLPAAAAGLPLDIKLSIAHHRIKDLKSKQDTVALLQGCKLTQPNVNGERPPYSTESIEKIVDVHNPLLERIRERWRMSGEAESKCRTQAKQLAKKARREQKQAEKRKESQAEQLASKADNERRKCAYAAHSAAAPISFKVGFVAAAHTAV